MRALLHAIVLAAAWAVAGVGMGAPSIADRSPFTQGHWWDPAKAGSGFDIFSANGQVGVVWFTFDENSRPVWYTAGGTLASMGAQAWPLLKHRWGAGGKQAPTVVGSLRLALRHAEGADLTWNLNGAQGTWKIEPLVVAGVLNEVDHSGHWFDPGNSGWGFSLVEQGEVLGGALFTYDAAGEPTWVSGYQRGGTRVDYLAFTGACPACAYRAPQSTSAGALQFEFLAETELVVRNRLSTPMAAGVNLDGARVVQLARAASTRPADRQLASFDNAASLKSYLDAGMLSLPPYSTSSFSAAPPAATFSPTNLQESGVDEADLVKSNGRFVYTFAHDANGFRQPTLRVVRVEDDGASYALVGTAALGNGATAPVGAAGLFLHGDRVVAVTGTLASSYGGSVWMAPVAWARGVTHVEVMEAAASGLPVSRWRVEIDGHIVSSRRIGNRLYVVSRYVPWLANFGYGNTYPQAVEANREQLARTPLADLMPKVRVGALAPTTLVEPANVFVPPQGARPPLADMILVTAIDLDTPRVVQSLAIAGSVDVVYASTSNLYLATSRYPLWQPFMGFAPPEPPFYLTDVHRIRIGGDAMAVTGSGSVEGTLGNDLDSASFRFSEYDNRLRVVTSSTQMWPNGVQNRLTILEPSTVAPGLLKTVAYLPNTKRPETLGKPFETLYGTRFVADRLYAVTFRLIDPLYVVDLANAADPRIAGALEVPGYSEYLHPLPNGLLLGFGKDAKPAQTAGDGQFAWYQGLQVALYDVRDAAKPRELQRVLVGKRGSESALLRDHHAFSALLQGNGAGTFAFPARIADGASPQYGTGDSASYPWAWSGLLRFELRGADAATAHLAQMPPLVTHSASSYPVYNDAATTTARSVLFAKGTLYIANGAFWYENSAGARYGPY